MSAPLRATDSSGEPISFGTFNGFEVYPMPMFATIAVADVAGLVAWYEGALGFRVMFSTPGPGGTPALVHLRRSKYQDILVTPAPANAGGTAPSSLTITFRADEDPAALAERARAVAPVGASAVTGPVDTPWNTTDVRVTDPAGHRLVFTAARANPDPEQQAKWAKLMEQARQNPSG
jgi:catechol 2,3-dioxygenase-like lactoylglutathione lyase family enzyme